MVHRDVKPGNLLRAREGEVKLADFGIAKATEQSSITQVGSVLGTAAYLAPEQARGEEAGPSADLYALGVVTYQLISGRLPYEASSLTELALKQQQEEPPTLDTLVAAVGPELADAVAVALALDPRDRYSTAREMRRGLRRRRQGDRARRAPSARARARPPRRPRAYWRRAARLRRPTRAVAPRRPRQGPAPSRERRPAAVAGPPPRRANRLLVAVLALLVLALVIVAVVRDNRPRSSKVALRNVVYADVQQARRRRSRSSSRKTPESRRVLASPRGRAWSRVRRADCAMLGANSHARVNHRRQTPCRRSSAIRCCS